MKARLSWILDDLPVGVWVGRVPDGQVAYANRAFRDMVGMDEVAESCVGDIPDTYHLRDREGRRYPVERLAISQVMATGAPAVVDDLVVHRGDGRRVHLRAMGHPVRDEGGQLTHVIVAFLDITREAEAEAARATLDAQLRYTVGHAPVVVYTIDNQGVITLSEGAGLKSLGFRSGELVGRSVFEVYKDHPTVSSNVRRALAGEAVSTSTRVGDAVMESSMTPLRDPSGAVVGVLGVAHDRTELTRLEAAAIQNDRVMAMGMLAASVAHEINNPLTYVLSYLDGVREELARQLGLLARAGSEDATLAALRASTEGALEGLQPVRSGLERIAAITRDLRTFSRPDDSRLAPVDVRAAVESVLKLLRKEIEARARLRLTIADTPPVLANEARIVQVVMNLLMNAVQSLAQAGPAQAEIHVTTRTQGSDVVIEVDDTGPGVAVEDRERIFEPFVTSKPMGQGTGLGLFVCRNIVRGLGGTIGVQDRPGGGARFRVVQPAARTPARADTPAPAPAPAPAGVALAGRRMLIIDDDATVAAAFASQLRAAGVSVETTPDARQALERMTAGEPFDLVYCDLMMAPMTGMDFAAALAARAPACLRWVVFMTGGAYMPAATAFVAANAGACVHKPFDVLAETRRRLQG
jgi:PAS domain S-box-containing protein